MPNNMYDLNASRTRLASLLAWFCNGFWTNCASHVPFKQLNYNFSPWIQNKQIPVQNCFGADLKGPRHAHLYGLAVVLVCTSEYGSVAEIQKNMELLFFF